MHEHDELSGSAVAKWAIRIAIVVFAGLGALELAVATIFHRVALGVDGAHNLVDGVVFYVNLRAQQWANLDEYSFWTCVGEPAAPLVASGVVVTGAVGFTVYESSVGGGVQTHQALTFVLLGLSLLANGVFAWVMYWDKQRRQRHNHAHNRHLYNAFVHAFWDMVSTLIGVVAYGLIAVGMGSAWDLVAAWVGAVLILWGHRREITKAWREIVFHRQPGHNHSHEPHHYEGPQEPDHAQ